MNELTSLLNDITETLKRYIILPNYGAEAISLYIFSTYLINIATFAPILLIKSPEMRCGKTTCMDIIGEIVKDPLCAVNASPAALFRAISVRHRCLMLDEVDTIFSMKTELSEAIRGIINAGHRRGGFSKILRCDGDRHDVKEFDVFGNKVLAGIGKIPATLSDRSIIVSLRRKHPDEAVERFRIAQLSEQFQELRTRCSSISEELKDKLGSVVPVVPTELSDRAADNWELMLAIAEIAGAEWVQVASSAAVECSEVEENESPGVKLLGDVKGYFADNPDTIKTSTQELLDYLIEIDTSPWATWDRGKGITAQRLASLLQPYDIRPSQMKSNGNKFRGYRKEDFSDAWDRYLVYSASTRQMGGTPVLGDSNHTQCKELAPPQPDVESRDTPVPEHSDGLVSDSSTGAESGAGSCRYSGKFIPINELQAKGTVVPASLEEEALQSDLPIF